jgi:hypothetical protein
VVTGKRLGLWRRLQFVKFRTWASMGLGAVATTTLLLIGVNLYRDFVRRDAQPFSASTPAHQSDHAAVEWVGRLLAAESAAERSEAFDQLWRLGMAGLPPLAEALAEPGAEGVGGAHRVRNRAAAVELLVRSGQSQWLSLLRKLQGESGLRETVLRARARLGDGTVAEELATLWLERLRRQMFLTRVAELAPSGVAAANDAIVRRACADAECYAEHLRGLAEPPGAAIIEELLATYWDSWSWLGQQRGEAFATELFELAKPPKRQDLEFKLRVRAARRALDRAAQRGAPAGRAAAAVVLAHCAPQYKSLRERMIATLASNVPDSDPHAQQRIAWALARLTGRAFGGLSDEQSPADFGRRAVQDVLKWARSRNLVSAGALRTRGGAYPRPPKLIRRVVTPRRQMERDLLDAFASGWAAVDEALDRWLEAELPCTPRVVQLLDPGRRKPDYPALAAAMILAAERGAQDLRPELELWQEALDQPAWVRGFAYTALAALDARNARWSSDWPADLYAEAVGDSGPGGPSWDLWGRLVAAGGPLLRMRLEEGPSSLPPRTRDRLLRAAEQAASRRSWEP